MVNMVKKINLKDEIIIYKEMILAIDIHRKAVMLVFTNNNFLNMH